MKEFNVEIEIDENGNIVADAKGLHGKVCEKALDDLLEGIDDLSEDKKKPEYFAKEIVTNKGYINNKLH